MYENPFQVAKIIEGDFEIEKSSTTITNINVENLTWNKNNMDYETYLTLDEIRNQIKELVTEDVLSNLIISYESALWGFTVAFENNNWIIVATSNGYA